jgi:ethanolamine utilization microcompartment shell protein EutL
VSEKLTEPEWVFPFQGMNVGDSFFIPTLRPANLIYSADTAAKADRIRVVCFATTKHDCLGVRVWRIA